MHTEQLAANEAADDASDLTVAALLAELEIGQYREAMDEMEAEHKEVRARATPATRARTRIPPPLP